MTFQGQSLAVGTPPGGSENHRRFATTLYRAHRLVDVQAELHGTGWRLASMRAGTAGCALGRRPGARTGRQPCIRGLRLTVWDVLGWLAAGKTEDQIIEDYPELEKDDFRAVYEYAARMGRRVAL
jgi:uncharacterized protein (DUF433 family)